MTSGNGTEGTTNVNPQEVAADLAKSVDKATRKVVSLTDKGPIKGFKKFISRGSMIDMAVGVVMGSAVTTVVNAISFGAILNAIINFLLIGVAVYFCIVLPINKVRDMTASEDEANKEPSTEEQTLAVLQEIRDELKRAPQAASAGKQ